MKDREVEYLELAGRIGSARLILGSVSAEARLAAAEQVEHRSRQVTR